MTPEFSDALVTLVEVITAIIAVGAVLFVCGWLFGSGND
jgi:hypothetical protein